MAEKTEQPSSRQKRKAREQGDVPVSAALSQAVAFAAALVITPSALSASFSVVGQLLQSTLQGRPLAMEEVALGVLRLALPVIAVAAFSALALGAV